MKISDWLDKKEAEGVDVSQIVLPDDLLYDEDPDETIFSRKLILTESSLSSSIRFLLSSALEIGITAGVATRQQVLICQERSGDCLQRIKISLSIQLNHT